MGETRVDAETFTAIENTEVDGDVEAYESNAGARGEAAKLVSEIDKAQQAELADQLDHDLKLGFGGGLMGAGAVGVAVHSIARMRDDTNGVRYGQRSGWSIFRNASIGLFAMVALAAFGLGFCITGGTGASVILAATITTGCAWPVIVGLELLQKPRDTDREEELRSMVKSMESRDLMKLDEKIEELMDDEREHRQSDNHHAGPPGARDPPRRRLSPSESVLEAINGTHHRRLAPLEALLEQIEASKQASLQKEIHSKWNHM